MDGRIHSVTVGRHSVLLFAQRITGHAARQFRPRASIVSAPQALVFTFLDRNDPLWQVDVFLTDDLSYEKLRTGSVAVSIEGHSVQIAGIEALIDLKRRIQPPRPKDILDLAELERLRRT